MADQTIFAVGAAAENEGTTVALALPAGSLAGKTLVAITISNATAPENISGPGGWSLLAGGVGGHGLLGLGLMYRHADGTESGAQTFDLTDSTGVFGFIVAVQDGLASGDPRGAVGPLADALADATVTLTAITPGSKDAVFFIAGCGRAVAAPTCSGYSGTAPTFTEFFDGGASSVTLGTFLSLHCAMGVQDTGASTGSRTATLSAAPGEWQGLMFSLKPAAAVGFSVAELSASATARFFFFNK